MTEKKNEHSHIYELVMQGSYELRRTLGIDDSSYTVNVSNASDSRKYYLHNVLNEVDKAVFSVMFANSFLMDNVGAPPLAENDKQLNSKILQTKIDELSMWRRKLVEILVDLIGFSKANNQNYYSHYNNLYLLYEIQKEINDQSDFYSCKNQIIAAQLQELKNIASQLSASLLSEKCWYAQIDKKTNHIKFTLEKAEGRFKKILPKAKKYQKPILFTYRNSFGKPSELLHPKRIVEEKLKLLLDLEQSIRAISILGLHVISAIKDLLRIHNTKGPLKQIANVIKKNTFPISSFDKRTKPKIVKGDFVITRDGPAQIMKVSTNEKYGYKKFHVRYLIQSPQISIVDEFIPDEIQFLGAQKMIKKEVLRILKEANPNLKPSGRHVNTAIKKQVIELWSLIGKNAP